MTVTTEICSKHELYYRTSVIKYSVIKSRRIKTSELIVDSNEVLVRTPFDKPDHEIQRIIQNKAKWILKKQKEYREMSPEVLKPTFEDGSTLPYLGKNYPLKIFTREAKNSISFADGQFIVNIWPSKNVTAQYVEKLYEHWLMKLARPVLKNKVQSYSEKLCVTEPKKVVIKRLKNRWGSIGKNGDTINLNVNLVKAPEDVVNYIILHELCHLRIKEHSHHYWDLLHKFMSNYEAKDNWLNINGGNLL
jgi:predicted metal-dependent hydrolase